MTCYVVGVLRGCALYVADIKSTILNYIELLHLASIKADIDSSGFLGVLSMASIFRKVAHELGLQSLHESPLDVKILILARFVRLLAYGASTLILALFLSALGVSDTKIGLFMTMTLLGDVLVSLILTLVADSIGRRTILLLGALLMTASGVVFTLSSNYWILTLASVLGVISPSGWEIGPFKAVEESTIAHLVPAKARPGVLAWYVLIGTAGTATGIMVGGWVVQTLQTTRGWTAIETYRLVFIAYAILGLIKFCLSLLLSSKCEPTEKANKSRPQGNDEREPLLAAPEGTASNPDEVPNAILRASDSPQKGSWWSKLLPNVSKESQLLLLQLCSLFAIDNFASGVANQSWTVYFFNRKFKLEEGKLGSLFFTTNIISALLSLVSASLARRIGPIKTMVFTHLPSSVALTMLAVPNDLSLAIALLIFRASTASMDQVPRQAFLAAAVYPHERTAVMGVINVIKTLCQSAGPFVTGILANDGRFWIAFLIAGGLKTTYDLLFLGIFVGHRTVEDKAEAIIQESAPSVDEQSTPRPENRD